MGNLSDGRLFQRGSTSISTDDSGDGTVDITFPETFDQIPKMMVIGNYADDQDGKYDVENNEGNMGSDISIEAFATYDSGNQTQITMTSHGLVADDVILIETSTHYDGLKILQSVVDADNFVIDDDYEAESIVSQTYILRPTISTTAATLKVVGSNVKNGTVQVEWFACEKLGA